MANKRMISRILALALSLSLVLMGSAFAEGKHLNGALYWFGSSLDPATEWDGWTTCRAGITETLVTVNEKYEIVPLLAANILGVIPGTWLLRFSMPWVIKTILGVVVVFLGLEMATRSIRPARKRADPVWVRYVVAVFSGVCAGLFGINMFLTAYLQRTAKDYDEFKGSICLLFSQAWLLISCFINCCIRTMRQS